MNQGTWKASDFAQTHNFLYIKKTNFSQFLDENIVT